MVCTPADFYCIRQTAPAVIIKVTEQELLATSPQVCRDGMNYIAGQYNCTEATRSGSLIRPDNATLEAINSTVFFIYIYMAIVIFLTALSFGISFYGRK